MARTKNTAHKSVWAQQVAKKTCPQRHTARKSVPAPHRFRPSAIVRQHIRSYEIQRRPFQRVVESLDSVQQSQVRFAVSALTSLQEAAEAYLVGLFEDGLMCARHAKRVTLTVKDLHLARRLRHECN